MYESLCLLVFLWSPSQPGAAPSTASPISLSASIDRAVGTASVAPTALRSSPRDAAKRPCNRKKSALLGALSGAVLFGAGTAMTVDDTGFVSREAVIGIMMAIGAGAGAVVGALACG